MTNFDPFDLTFEQIKQKISKIISDKSLFPDNRDTFAKILSFVDLTSLEGADTQEKIRSVCKKARHSYSIADEIDGVAAVCFYPELIKTAKEELKNTTIKVVSAAAGFPAGQIPLEIKKQEVEFAISQGADEIDIVLSRGKFLEGRYDEVGDEVAQMKSICGDIHLKVILETGELETVDNIRKASEIAINGGADFIKTSTGKIQPAATPEAFYIMASTVAEYYTKTGKMIGLKPAGGISTAEQAIQYMRILFHVAGPDWLDKDLFRIGASRLTDQLIEKMK